VKQLQKPWVYAQQSSLAYHTPAMLAAVKAKGAAENESERWPVSIFVCFAWILAILELRQQETPVDRSADKRRELGYMQWV
jgi:hypothetical protein